MNKQDIINALHVFISQRSGMDFRNYDSGDRLSSRESYMNDYKPILAYGKAARDMLIFVARHDSVTAENLLEAARRAFSGRLEIVERKGRVSCLYTTGQYFPTEYRRAACAVLSQAIRERIMQDAPKPTLHHNTETGELLQRYMGDRIGDYVRKQARLQLGRGLAKRFFN